MDDVEVGQRVRTARGDMSQMQLAETMNARGLAWTQTTVTATETGRRPLRFAEAVALADELGVSLDWLAGLPPTESDRLRQAARLADERLHRARDVLDELIRERDALLKPWEG